MSAGGEHVPGTGIPAVGTGGHMKPPSALAPSPVPPSSGSPLADPLAAPLRVLPELLPADTPVAPELPLTAPLAAPLELPLISLSLPLLEPLPEGPVVKPQPVETSTRMGPASHHPPKLFL